MIEFEEPQNPEDRRQYSDVFHLMHEKRRFHVVGNCNPKFVKDFYVFPLAEGEKLHRALRGTEGDPGVDPRHPPLIMGKGLNNKYSYLWVRVLIVDIRLYG